MSNESAPTPHKTEAETAEQIKRVSDRALRAAGNVATKAEDAGVDLPDEVQGAVRVHDQGDFASFNTEDGTTGISRIGRIEDGDRAVVRKSRGDESFEDGDERTKLKIEADGDKVTGSMEKVHYEGGEKVTDMESKFDGSNPEDLRAMRSAVASQMWEARGIQKEYSKSVDAAAQQKQEQARADMAEFAGRR